MKANLTRGNSITENHNPFATPQDCFDIAFAIIDEILRKQKPLPKYPKGGVQIKYPEVAFLSKGVQVMPHNDVIKILKSDV